MHTSPRGASGGTRDPWLSLSFFLHSCHCVPDEVHLVASVPGVFSGRDLDRYGHMRLRSLLPAYPKDGDISYQCSSLGTVLPQWLAEFEESVGLRRTTKVLLLVTAAQPSPVAV